MRRPASAARAAQRLSLGALLGVALYDAAQSSRLGAASAALAADAKRLRREYAELQQTELQQTAAP